jgi:polysaccharide deacetylase 2 family uncharacterized protein YibQ
MRIRQRPGSLARARAFLFFLFRPALRACLAVLFASLTCLALLAGPATCEETPAASTAETPKESTPAGRLDDEAVRRVDQALIAALSTAGVDALRMVRVDPPYKPDSLLQYIEISTPAAPDIILDALDKSLADIVPSASVVTLAPEVVQIVYNHAPTHVISIKSSSQATARPRPEQDTQPGPQDAQSAEKKPRKPSGPRLVLVIDDMGESLKPANELIALGLTLNFSVFPYGPATSKVVAAGRAAGYDILLHQPMEPLDADGHNPGEGALFCRMSDKQLQSALRANLKRVPGVVGLNNHMGSRFTQDRAALASVLVVLKEKKLLCLDSLTHPKSVFAATGKSMGVPCLKRDVFLDLVREEQAVLRELERAERIARKHGTAIAIGHPVASTIAALRAWKSQRDKNVTLVGISSLMQ